MAEYTIDELARAADTTVRSVRVYHERGLLPSPDVRGRIGYYSPDHLERLHTISRLLSRGMKLNGIRELLEAWDRGDGLADVLGVADQPPTAPPPDHLAQSAPELPGYLQEALAGSDDPLDAYRLNNPRCGDLATRLVDAGVPVVAAFELVERLRADCERIADDHATELFYHLAGHAYERSERTPRDRTKLETDLAITRMIVTRAVEELVGQAFERRAEIPAPPRPAQ
ncbi:MerR family transcriptional regulator [Nocardia sp. BMG111209]|uniref:MerR family transcriptional regulator n=1 Tax=Nocardia sp. BMG111209 TaxID=1160137 RepID=UPI00036680E7|nr:MerR family transcriptional regulator [Nocardia sp. BMG111209]